ncbi:MULTISPECIES: YceD family protein [Caproicibacterium]|jgi:uncharacterized protein|uniref:DUF177 domain-containing protein n=1 Tax=Caproicibacterium lactatifermentans TaxID=2666138 RepID=A0A859DR96_9FIRM|nr:DUF177 domain-containing protein [Caproicibacterium lactatifermentans]ARP50259.1 nucleic acid-binding protein [Ruminococcaceae bacterium CPB6]MDD4807868.1 DUF177 domain-containing protein [Oscillospiraceae bacterium]QKN24019.1 DUF177 domain-containing protein [Caproicibacterium lactatifermentans]QKO30910.1 DUF177 domain-containing protein [Caproicibacterium lactatifermentans]
MLLNLKKKIQEDGTSLPLQYSFDLSKLSCDAVYPFVSPVQVEGTVDMHGGFAQLQAAVSFDFSVPCDRCTAQINKRLTYRFSHTLVPSLTNERDADDDRYVVLQEDGSLDLDHLLQEDILLALPNKFLCREDCKGLCPICGKNLNDGPCGCSHKEIDPRLEVLKQLIK